MPIVELYTLRDGLIWRADIFYKDIKAIADLHTETMAFVQERASVHQRVTKDFRDPGCDAMISQDEQSESLRAGLHLVGFCTPCRAGGRVETSNCQATATPVSQLRPARLMRLIAQVLGGLGLQSHHLWDEDPALIQQATDAELGPLVTGEHPPVSDEHAPWFLPLTCR